MYTKNLHTSVLFMEQFDTDYCVPPVTMKTHYPESATNTPNVEHASWQSNSGREA